MHTLKNLDGSQIQGEREKVILKRSQTIWFYCVLFSKGQNYKDGEQISGRQGYTGT